jgi:imidazolonepropionase-like amidohydrolase
MHNGGAPRGAASVGRRVLTSAGSTRMHAVLAGTLVLSLASPALAQAPPSPAPTLVRDVRLEDGGEPVSLLLRHGRIEAVLDARAARPAGVLELDGGGLLAVPGLIDAHARSVHVTPQPEADQDQPVGVGADVRIDMRLANRKGVQPSSRATDALALEKLGDWRERGFGHLVASPGGELLAGSSALLTTRDAAVRDLVVAPEVFAHAAFAARGEGYPSTLMGYHAQLRQFFLDSARHVELNRRAERGRAGPRPAFDPELDEGVRLIAGDLALACEAPSARAAERWMRLADELGLRIVLTGGNDTWEVADELAARGIPVILTLDWSDEVPEASAPGETDDEADEDSGEEGDAEPAEQADADEAPRYREPLRVREERRRLWEEHRDCAIRLREAGVAVAFGTGEGGAKQLLERVRELVEAGLDRDDALHALTAGAAELLGEGERLGSIERGRDATFALWTEHPTEPGARVARVFVDGFTEEFDVSAKEAGGPPAEGVDPGGRWTLVFPGSDGFQLEGGTLELEMDEDGGLRGTVSYKSKRSGQTYSGSASGAVSGAEISVAGTISVADRYLFEFEFDLEQEGDELVGRGSLTGEGALAAAAASGQGVPVEHPSELESDRAPSIQTGRDCIVRGAKIHSAVAPPFVGDVQVKGGRISRIGSELENPGVLELDGTGMHLAPGVVDTHSHMAIEGGVNEGTVSITADCDIADAIDADDLALYRALAGGTTTIQVLHGSANAIGGQAEVLELHWPARAEELRFAGAPQGVKFALGENPKRSNWGSGERFPASRPGVELVFERGFARAAEYARAWASYEEARTRGDDPVPPRRDLRLDALVAVLTGDLEVHSHCYRADEIVMLLRTAERHGFRVKTLQHVLEGYKVAPEMAEHGVGGSTFSDWWSYKIEAYDAIPTNAMLMDEAGVLSSVNSDSDELVRHLYQEAGKSVRYGGMDRVRALALVTINPAVQLGVADRVGSIEVGKDANLVLLDGDPLEFTSKVLWTMVRGELEFQRRDAFELAERPAPARELPQAPRPERAELTGGDVVAIVGGTLHPVSHAPIERGVLLVQDGRILALGQDLPIPEGALVVDATAKHIWPGIVALDTPVGLFEIGSVRGTNDKSEIGGNHPDLSVASSIHPDSAHVGVTRTNGITRAQTSPQGGGPLAGRSAVIRLDGVTWEEMVVLVDDMLHLRFPRVPNRVKGDDEPELPEAVAELEDLFERARQHGALLEEAASGDALAPPLAPRLAALAPYARGEGRVAVHARNAATILAALEFVREQELDAVLYGALEGWKVADAIAGSGLAVAVGPVLALPLSEFDPYDGPYANPALLRRAGVELALLSGDDENPRNLVFHAAAASAFGLPREEAIRAITLGAAEVLGVAEEVGSLEPGKVADVIVTDGDLLSTEGRVTAVLIDGVLRSMENRQTRLHERYRQRLARPPGR